MTREDIEQIKNALEDSNEILTKSFSCDFITQEKLLKFYSQNRAAIKLLDQSSDKLKLPLDVEL